LEEVDSGLSIGYSLLTKMSFLASQCQSLNFISKTLVHVLVLATFMIHPLVS